uniref:Uncharacterized protein n=1 Tax=Anguilla anguilla TaxID=7936 RepID=A0A0E9SWX0_ANGAN
MLFHFSVTYREDPLIKLRRLMCLLARDLHVTPE